MITAEILDSKELYLQMLNMSSNSFLVLEEDIIVFANNYTLSLFGYNENDLLNQSIFSTIFSKSLDLDNIKNINYKAKCKNNQELIVNLSISKYPAPLKTFSLIMIIDVTHKTALLNMFHKEVKLSKSIIETSPTYFVSIDIDGSIRFVNNTFLNSFEYNLNDLITKKYTDILLSDEEKEAFIEILKDIITFKKNHIFEHSIISSSGEVKYIEWHSSPIFDDIGELDYFFCIGIDITNRKEIQNNLLNELNKASFISANLNQVFNNSQDLMWAIDINYNFIIYNEKFKDYFLKNFDKQVEFGQNFIDILPQEIQFFWYEKCENSICVEKNTFEYKNFKNNQIFKIFISTLKKTDSSFALIFYANDITELKNAQYNLEKNEYLLKEAQHISQTGHWELNLQTNTLIWSDEVYRIFDLEPQSFIPTLDYYINSIYKEDREYVLNAINLAINKHVSYDIEHRLLSKNNEIKYVKNISKFEFNSTGNKIRLIGIIHDITNIKKATDKIVELNKNLEEKVHIRTQELIEANSLLENANLDLIEEINERINLESKLNEAVKIAEQANKIKSEFIANMSHEIRTPINAIIGFNYLLEKTKLNVTQEEYLKKSKISAINLLNIVNDILDFSKIEANKLFLEEIYFNFDELISNLVMLFKSKSDEKGLDFILNKDANIPTSLYGDSFRLNQILINLISNAIKFTNKGFIKIDINSTFINSNDLKLSFNIIDSGIGIKKDYFSKIFNPFTQSDSSITRTYGGTGLGLSISKKLIELMGGSISVESTENIGSRFSFDINFKISQFDISKTKTPDIAPSIKDNLKILLVEDNEINQFMAQDILESLNMIVETAENGLIAYNLIKEGKRFDIILMDIHMPVLDGYMATLKIRELNCNTPIIAMTADVVKGVKQKVLSSGMNEYISKPIDPINLIKKIHELSSNINLIENIHFYIGLNRVNGNITKYNMILNIFLKQYSNSLDRIKDLISSNSIIDALNELHKLSHACENIGYKTINVITHDLDNYIKFGDFQNINQHFILLSNKFENLLKSIKAFVDE